MAELQSSRVLSAVNTICESATDDRNQRLADELARLDVPFLRGGQADLAEPMEPTRLLMGLATSSEARLRLALIPLLICHPAFAFHVRKAVNEVPFAGQVVLRCYYTAAHLLQRKYGYLQSPLPDLFSSELGIDLAIQSTAVLDLEAIETDLNILAATQAKLSGRAINWRGTYGHSVRFLHKTLKALKL